MRTKEGFLKKLLIIFITIIVFVFGIILSFFSIYTLKPSIISGLFVYILIVFLYLSKSSVYNTINYYNELCIQLINEKNYNEAKKVIHYTINNINYIYKISKIRLINFYYYLGIIYETENNIYEAKRNYLITLRISKSIKSYTSLYKILIKFTKKPDNSKILGSTYNKLSLISSENNNIKKSINYIKKGILSEFKYNKKSLNLHFLYHNYAKILLAQMDSNNTEKYFLKSIHTLENLTDINTFFVISAYSDIGNYYFDMENYNKANKYFLKIISTKENIQEKILQAYEKLTIIAKFQCDHIKAMNLLLSAINRCSEEFGKNNTHTKFFQSELLKLYILTPEL